MIRITNKGGITVGNQWTIFSYKQLQTMKRALLDYMMRKDVTDSDKHSENALLLKINYQIELLTEKTN